MLKNGTARFMGRGNRSTEGDADDLTGARIITTVIVNGVPRTAIELVAGVNKYRCVGFADCQNIRTQSVGGGVCADWKWQSPLEDKVFTFGPFPRRIGESLELVEQEWLVSEINAFLEGRRGRAPQLEDMGSAEAPEVYDDGDLGVTAGNKVGG